MYSLLSTFPNDSPTNPCQTISSSDLQHTTRPQPKCLTLLPDSQGVSLPHEWHQCAQTLTGWFADFDFQTLARATGFVLRTPRKIMPEFFLQATILLVCQGTASLSRWATLLGILSNNTIAKQSLWERMNQGAVNYIQCILALVLSAKSKDNGRNVPNKFNRFPRILVHDSTTIKVNSKLAAAFPGSANQSGSKIASLKIQAIQDIQNQQFLYFGISGFRRNDQTATYDILKVIRKGDLILRDLGYFVIESFQQIANAGAYYLSRIRLDIEVRDPATGEKIDLLKKLKRLGNLDFDVLLSDKQLPVRLVAIKLPDEIAAERRRKAKSNRDKRRKPNAQRLELLGWAIFTTNVPQNECTAKEVAKIYGLRWRIETIFKAWKSHFRITEVPDGSAEQLRIVVCARLIFITVLTNLIERDWLAPGQTCNAAHLSMLKVAALLGDYFLALCFEAWNVQVGDAIPIQMRYQCKYDKRSRQNYEQNLLALS